jgi:hypothetical protein
MQTRVGTVNRITSERIVGTRKIQKANDERGTLT